MHKIRQKSKIYYQYVVQLYQNGKFKRYLRDNNGTPFTFDSRGLGNLFAKEYLTTRRKKSFSIKVVPIKIRLPKPESYNE